MEIADDHLQSTAGVECHYSAMSRQLGAPVMNVELKTKETSTWGECTFGVRPARNEASAS